MNRRRKMLKQPFPGGGQKPFRTIPFYSKYIIYIRDNPWLALKHFNAQRESQEPPDVKQKMQIFCMYVLFVIIKY